MTLKQEKIDFSDRLISLIDSTNFIPDFRALESKIDQEFIRDEEEARPIPSEEEKEPVTGEGEEKPVTEKVEEKPAPAVELEEKPVIEKPEEKPVTEKVEEKPAPAVELEEKPVIEKPEAKPVTEKAEEKPAPAVELEEKPVIEKPEAKPVTEKAEEKPAPAVELEEKPVIEKPEAKPTPGEAIEYQGSDISKCMNQINELREDTIILVKDSGKDYTQLDISKLEIMSNSYTDNLHLIIKQCNNLLYGINESKIIKPMQGYFDDSLEYLAFKVHYLETGAKMGNLAITLNAHNNPIAKYVIDFVGSSNFIYDLE
ncbi:hypothetical protein NOVO_03575 [Rickettsiales bacterium Ac37b]|nr:hypothetical protein NOVO_03575 [Rickettsiales bacterium Ac37b]